jgi:hypothetical protein
MMMNNNGDCGGSGNDGAEITGRPFDCIDACIDAPYNQKSPCKYK